MTLKKGFFVNGINTDEKVKVNIQDPTAGYLIDKIAAEYPIIVGQGTGENENKILISIDDLCALILQCPTIQDLIKDVEDVKDDIEIIEGIIEDSETFDVVFHKIKYGFLYNRYAAIDARKIFSSDDWDLPSHAMLVNFATFLGGYAVGGGKMKETGFTYWDSPNTGATNSTRLSFRGSGVRSGSGVFSKLYRECPFHKLGDSGNLHARVDYNSEALAVNLYLGTVWGEGTCVRGVKMNTNLSEGQTGYYIGNNKKVYRTTCVMGVEWLAENLAETEFRNGDPIPEMIIDADWSNARVTEQPAMCAYDNSYDNV